MRNVTKYYISGKKPVCLIRNTILNSTDQTIYRVKKGFVDVSVLGIGLDNIFNRVTEHTKIITMIFIGSHNSRTPGTRC